MKALTVSLLMALSCAGPALAQAPPAPAAPAAQPAPPDEATPLDALIEQATTLDERVALLRRCAGPPPRPVALTERPVSMPAVAIEQAAAGIASGG